MEMILLKIQRGNIKNVIPKIVISSKKNAPGLEKAKKYGINTETILTNLKGWEYDQIISKILYNNDVIPDTGLICLAGYMRILSPEFVKIFRMKILNIHPSLLPSFPGLKAQSQALEYGVKITGCTVHFVDEGLDSGPIIAQKPVLIYENDDEKSLSNRILEQEHILYPYCVKLIGEDRIKIKNRIVKINY